MKTFFVFGCYLILTLSLRAQEPALWNSVHTGFSMYGMVQNNLETKVIVWGTRVDSCFQSTPTLIVLDTNGTFLADTSYVFEYCRDEGASDFQANPEGGYYLIAAHSSFGPGDSSYVHFIDDNFTVQWTKYLGWDTRSAIDNYNRRNYISVDENGQNRRVLRFYQPGQVDTLNQIFLPYFQWAPTRVFATNGLVFEFGHQTDLDSAFVCMIYDTTGNFQSSFSFDADANEVEVPQYVTIHNNRIFHTNQVFNSNTYPACSDLSGTTHWIDTLSHPLHVAGVSLDTVSDVAFVMCNTSTDNRLYSYDLYTGVLIDSMIIDSVYAPSTGIKSGPAGGVFLFYRKYGTDTLLLAQYDAQFNLIWRGYTQHPTCSSPCTAQQFIFDSIGNVYTVSYCSCSGLNTLVSKFSPSLVSIPENSPEQNIVLFPNPATTEVRIQLNGQNGNHVVHISNSLGQIVRSEKFTGTSYQMSIDLLPSGVYFVQVITESGSSHAEKLIIQH
jgi:hypothetical protein